MPLVGNDPRVEACGWRILSGPALERGHWQYYAFNGFEMIGPFPRFIDVIDAALEKERGK